MKIAVVTRSTVLHFSSGGMETHLKNLLEGLQSAGHVIDVITTSLPNPDKIEKQDQIKIIDYVKYHFLGNTTPGLNPLSKFDQILVKLKLLKRGSKYEGKYNFYDRAYQYYSELALKNNFDIVISQSTATQKFVNYHANSLAILHGTIKTEIKNRISANKTLKNWVRFLISDYPNWLVEKKQIGDNFYSKLDQIIVVSNQLKESFISEHPEYKNKVEVIYNGVDQSKFLYQKKIYPKVQLELLYVGRIDREKGVDVLVEMMKLLIANKVNAKLTLVGDGIHFNEIKDQIKNQNLQDYINLTGPVQNDLVVNYYQSADLFLFATKRFEGHPMTICEANCTGLPVISTGMGGLKELIVNGQNGVLVQGPDPKIFADMVTKLYLDQVQLSQLSHNSHQYGVKKFSRSAMINRYQTVIAKIIESNFS